MPKRFFVSTKKDRNAQADSLSDALRAYGWERTFAWTPDDGAEGSGYAAIAVAEVEGVRAADVSIVLLPGGYGTHVEIGIALALGKRVILHTPDRKTLGTPYPCVFHYHPQVRLMISDPLDINAVLSACES